MKVDMRPEMIDSETVVLNIKLTMSASWFLMIIGQVYSEYVGRPLDMGIKKIDSPG